MNPLATDDIVALELDNTGDLVVEQDALGNKAFKLIRGQKAIRQNIQVRLLTQRGERLLHPDYGIDFPSIETPFDEDLVRGEVIRTILQDPDVQEIVDITVTFDSRKRQATILGNVRLKDDSVIGIAGVA